MGIVVHIFALTLLLGSCLAQFAEFNVTFSDMNVPMEEFAVGETLLILSNGTDALTAADKLVSIMNTKYGEGWFYIVGENIGIKGLTQEKNSTLQIQIKSTKVKISRLTSKADHRNQMNLEEIIKQARNSAPIQVQGKIKSDYDIFTSKAKEVLSSNIQECVNTTTTAEQEMCFYEMSSKMYNLVPKNLKIVAEVGLYGHYFSYADNDAYAFKMGDIYFIIRLLQDSNSGPVFTVTL